MNVVEIASSDVGNTYGGLSLVRALAPSFEWQTYKEGDYYLCMEDCFGPDFSGPLTEEQVRAFFVLFDVEDPR